MEISPSYILLNICLPMRDYQAAFATVSIKGFIAVKTSSEGVKPQSSSSVIFRLQRVVFGLTPSSLKRIHGLTNGKTRTQF